MKVLLKKYGITALSVVIALLLVRVLWGYYMLSPWTRDARIRADIVTIAPNVSGYITNLNIKDNMKVQEGDILLEIDPVRYKASVAKAEAFLEMKEATLRAKEHEANRRNTLDANVISSELKENALIDVAIAKADVNEAKAALSEANIDLERSVIRAPKSGIITNLTTVVGNYVTNGQPIVAIVVKDSFYVQAYMEETKIPRIQEEMPVSIHLMNNNVQLKGEVESISAGISDQNSTADSQLLANVTPTFNWVRLAQRIPVRIKIDKIPENVQISAGMTASVRIGKIKVSDFF